MLRSNTDRILTGTLLLALYGTSIPCRAAEPPPDSPAAASSAERVLTGREALGDWTTDAPGVRRKITQDDLAPPFETPSVDNGPRRMAPRPKDAWPRAPQGFNVSEFATGLTNPRVVVTAPNGDIFLAESYPGRVRVLRDSNGDGKPEINEVYASGFNMPFGIAFYPNGPKPTHIYVANTNSLVRFAYNEGDTKAQSKPETIVPELPGFARLRGGGHWTRDVVFSPDSMRMFVSVGSHSNVSDDESEKRRADILVFDPEGKDEKVYASGIRNAVGLAIHPQTGQVWASVNERDALGDHLVPDYVTHVEEGGFYGWPWYYIGAHQDPRHKGKHPELKDRVIVPDVLLQSHSASLCMTFYTGQQFPEAYRSDAFAAEHGSWNRARRTGYKVIRIPIQGRQGHRRIRGLPSSDSSQRRKGRSGAGRSG